MINGAIPRSNNIVKSGYDDWVELLEHTGNTEMLKDPYNVWEEAFHVGTMVERHGILHVIQTQVQLVQPAEHDYVAMMSVDDVKQIQIKLLQQVMELIASKGLIRQSSQ
jgi:hypothetical protein